MSMRAHTLALAPRKRILATCTLSRGELEKFVIAAAV
jgi:hypothetical protein